MFTQYIRYKETKASMNIKTAVITVAALFAAAASVAALPPVFNTESYTEQELQDLADGKVLIRNIDKAKNISLNPIHPAAQRAIDTMTELKPAYLAEIIQIRPAAANETLIDDLAAALLNIEGYIGIPYYSQRAERWYDLYEDAHIQSAATEGGTTKMNAILVMEPFGDIDTDILLEKDESVLYYETVNKNKLRYYDRFTCVKPYNMKSIITVFPSADGQSYILYALGGVDAPSIFFLRSRIETSFMNRISTFCSYFFDQF